MSYKYKYTNKKIGAERIGICILPQDKQNSVNTEHYKLQILHIL